MDPRARDPLALPPAGAKLQRLHQSQFATRGIEPHAAGLRRRGSRTGCEAPDLPPVDLDGRRDPVPGRGTRSGAARDPPDGIRDPWARALWPDFVGRDGVRFPIPWDAEARHCGFTEGETPFRRIPEIHRALAVDRQDADPNSVLNFTRRLLAWRRRQKILRIGEQSIRRGVPKGVVAFERILDGQRMSCAANFGEATVELDLSSAAFHPAFTGGMVELEDRVLTLGPFAFAALSLKSSGCQSQ